MPDEVEQSPFVPDLAFIRERMPSRTARGAFLTHALRHFEDVVAYAERLEVGALREGDTRLTEWESHEGMVTVYDAERRYMGCMGIETWRKLVAEEDALLAGARGGAGAGNQQ